jgi:hypothetical protein
VVDAETTRKSPKIPSHFFYKFAIEARTFMTTDTDGPSSAHPTAWEQEIFAVLESVGNTSANVLTEIKNVIHTSDSMTAGLTTTSVISILGFFESENERTAVLVDYVHASTGESTSITTATLKRALAKSGVLDGTIDFLSSQRNKSGLSAVLVKLTRDMKLID